MSEATQNAENGTSRRAFLTGAAAAGMIAAMPDPATAATPAATAPATGPAANNDHAKLAPREDKRDKRINGTRG